MLVLQYVLLLFSAGDFDVEGKKRTGKPEMFPDTELQALLDENDAQMQQEFAEQLGVARSTISDRLKAMGKIQKEEK